MIVNVSSTVTLKSIPLISIYSASKHALNGFTQSFGDSEGPTTESVDVAEAVRRAATDPSAPTRIPAGADAVIWAREAMMSAATA